MVYQSVQVATTTILVCTIAQFNIIVQCSQACKQHLFRFGCGHHIYSFITHLRIMIHVMKNLVKLLTVVVIVLKFKSSPIQESAQQHQNFYLHSTPGIMA